MVEVEQKKHIFRKFTYCIDLNQTLNMSYQQLIYCTARGSIRGRKETSRGSSISMGAALQGPEGGCTQGETGGGKHLSLEVMIILPLMVASMMSWRSIYNCMTFNQGEIKPKMIGHHLSKLSITYKPVTPSWGPLTAASPLLK
uniref:40S ribosomal protein S15 n=1 Tax=Bos indicus x Bos taurus TaxID=30522 RepID=A0A4W2HWR4_BOBOX